MSKIWLFGAGSVAHLVEHLPSIQEVLSSIHILHKLSVAAHAFNLITLGVEVGRSEVQGKSWLSSIF